MAVDVKSETRRRDRFKGVVTAGLLIVIVLLLLAGRTAPTEEALPEGEPPAAEIALPVLNAPTVGEGGSISLPGTGEPGATVELWAGEARLGAVVVGQDGAWSWNGSLEPGEYQLSARTVDASGKTLNEGPALAVSVPEPVVEVALPMFNVPAVDEEGSVSLSGTGEPGATIELWASDVKLGDVLAGGDGAWSWAGRLEPGDYQLSARTVDASGQVLNEETAALALKVPEPVVEVALPTFDAPVLGEDGSVRLSGTGEPGATLALWAGDLKLGEAVAGADGTWSWEGTLEPGDYQLSARTVDPSGQVLNEGTAALDLSVPEPAEEVALLTFDAPVLGEGGSVRLSGTGEPGATVALWAGDVKLGEVVADADGAWSWEGTLAPGEYELSARTVDASGQVLNEARAKAFTVAAEVTPTVPAQPTEAASTTPGQDQAYIVQPGDSLMAIAQQVYGDWQLWRLIFEATNERAAEDPTFHVIEDPNLIRPGWKLWIPAQEE